MRRSADFKPIAELPILEATQAQYPVYHRRHVTIRVTVDTNMRPAEIGDLVEGTTISIAEFGKEHLDMPRYDEVILRVIDSDYEVQT